MLELIELSCRSCGGKLEVHADDDLLACGHCGAQMMVQRRGGGVSLKGVEAAIGRVQAGTDRTAAELAIVRHKGELEALEARRTALFAANKWNPGTFEVLREQTAKRRARVGWTVGRKLRWACLVTVLVVSSIGTAMTDGRPQGTSEVARVVIYGVTQGLLISAMIYGAKQWVDRSHDKQVATVEAIDAEIGQMRARIAEKTRLADS